MTTLHNGCRLQIRFRLGVITEAELYAATVRQQRRARRKRARSTEGMLKDLSELRENDPVVHEQHGVGRYRGLVNLDLGEGETEFLLLEYYGDDKLYVPVSQLFLISRYSGGPPESAPLHRLRQRPLGKSQEKSTQADSRYRSRIAQSVCATCCPPRPCF
jgi:transcription-repair coupling factor (superfamily II helicase)